jgi:5-methylcytosine-specific restriction endonuclease McrA
MEKTIQTTQKQAERMALSMYVGELCTECGHKFDSVDDIIERDPVCSKKDENGLRFACRECFNKK